MRIIKHIELSNGQVFPALHVERYNPDGKRPMYKIQHEDGGWQYYDVKDVVKIIPLSDEQYKYFLKKHVYA